MIPLCKEIEEKIVKYIWRTRAISRRSVASVISGISAVPSSNSVIGNGDGTASLPQTPTNQPSSNTGVTDQAE